MPTLTCNASHPGDSNRNGADFTITVTNPSGSSNGVTQTGTTVGYSIPARVPGVSNLLTFGTTNTGSVQLTLQDNSTQDGTREVTVNASRACTPGTYWWYNVGGRDQCAVLGSATLTIMDDEAPSPELVVNEGSDNATAVTEAGSADSFTVALSTNPSANVSVSVKVDDDDTDECEVSLDGGNNYLAAGNSGTLTFVPTGGSTTAARTELWGTAQTVTVRAVDDTTSGEADATCDVELDPSSTDADYNGLSTATVDVTVTDNDLALSVNSVSGEGFSMGEGLTSTFRLSSNLAVPEQVTIALSVTPVSPTVAADVTLSTTSLTIASGMNDSGTFVVTAVDDDVDKGQNTYSFLVNVDATGGNVEDRTFQVDITDNDDAAVALSDLAQSMNPRETVTEAGGTATFDVALTTQPSAAVTVAVSSSDDGECRVSTAGSATPAASKTLTFTAMNWSTAQTVTLTGQDDDADDGDQDCTITAAASSPGSGGDAVYNSDTEVPDVSFTARNTDNDDAALSVTGLAQNTAPHETVTEAGGTATFNVALATRPTANVTVTVSSSDAGECRVSVGSAAPGASTTLTFSAANWSAARTVTLTGRDDAVDDGDQDCTITAAAASTGDTVYNSDTEVPDVTFTARNTDDDDAALVLSELAASMNPRETVTEGGGTAAFKVALASEPTADVTVTVTSSDAGECRVSTAGSATPAASKTLTFTAATAATLWSTPQEVTLTGQERRRGRRRPGLHDHGGRGEHRRCGLQQRQRRSGSDVRGAQHGRRHGRPGAVEDLGGDQREHRGPNREPGHVHGEAGVAADGGRDRRPHEQRHGRGDGEPVEPDVHHDDLGHRADGDGDRRGRRLDGHPAELHDHAESGQHGRHRLQRLGEP